VGATIRPSAAADLAPLTGFFAGLSTRTRVQRFFAPIRPTPAMVRRACGQAGPASPAGSGGAAGQGGPAGQGGQGGPAGQGGQGGPAGAAGQGGPAGQGGRTDVLVATHDGMIIGHAMAADRATAGGGSLTEIGVVVADAWQGRGVGSALVRTLVSRARARGVTSLSMDVLPGNRQVLAMITAHWAAAQTRRSTDCVTVQVGLWPDQEERRQPALTPHGERATRRELAYRG
jgi:GNAT superfamily N-acetyltransferase